MIETEDIITGKIKAYGKEGDPLVHTEKTQKVIIVKNFDKNLNKHTFIGDEVEVKINSEHENFYFGTMIGIANKKEEYKYRLLLDIGDLLYMDKEMFSFSKLKNNAEVPSDLKKKGVKKILLTIQKLMREKNNLEHELKTLKKSKSNLG